MKKIFLIALAAASGITLMTTGCSKDFLTNDPTSILTTDQVFGSKELAFSALADLYKGYVDQQTITNWSEFTNFDEAFPSEAGNYWRAQQTDFPYSWWSLWNYDYIRNINIYISRCKGATALDDADKARFIAEARFLRAANYFELVKRMGGVPIVTEALTYDYSGDPSYLQQPRAKESEVYDFVLSELDTAMVDLPDDASVQDRASKGLCLAMKSRAALYAASIAKFGSSTPSVSLSGGEVGIASSEANKYYQISRNASLALVKSGKYSLYMKKPDDLADNFAALFYDKGNNPEVIFAQNFKLKSGTIEGWTLNNQPRAIAEEAQGGRVNPTLNLALKYETLDNKYTPFVVKNGSDYAYYENEADIFNNRDARLAGTFILPGSQFKGKDVDIWAGYFVASSGAIVTSGTFGGQAQLPDRDYKEQAVGFSGPIDGLEFAAQTGFYVRKFMDPATGSGQIGTQSEVWWVRYRFGEVLLNLAEAEYELGNKDSAALYINQIRKRAGFTKDLTANDMSFDRIVHERRVELAFEGHELFDNKRWRIAHKVWNGQTISASELEAGVGTATAPNTMAYGLWPYKVYAPGKANDGKWIYKVVKPGEVTAAHRFQLGNYYSTIDQTIISNNPKIIKNPNQ
ncbi:Starch-binding associating with outer membrane [Arachidicoccus rhizosphaerae]|uniref:Starch-binding associating with outer membrane n=1 Tax=Arachidicoccus rhizosphaerae TaxID=551991 RepID=A0A1H4AI72_9BACT|nr:RagB/SusD family nutrient uptake outer membrane protein [Arachidicoccus rhizosphaerae]SEA35713.1 Starch-binding associating with outer membrane [Arachidicoccus rhizosphaerae]